MCVYHYLDAVKRMFLSAPSVPLKLPEKITIAPRVVAPVVVMRGKHQPINA